MQELTQEKSGIPELDLSYAALVDRETELSNLFEEDLMAFAELGNRLKAFS